MGNTKQNYVWNTDFYQVPKYTLQLLHLQLTSIQLISSQAAFYIKYKLS